MRKKLYQYSIPGALIDLIPSGSRSGTVEKAVKSALEDTDALRRAFINRLKGNGLPHSRPTRVTLNMDQVVPGILNTLAEKCQLPVEHVLRLALEDFMTKDLLNEPARRVQHAGEGGYNP